MFKTDLFGDFEINKNEDYNLYQKSLEDHWKIKLIKQEPQLKVFTNSITKISNTNIKSQGEIINGSQGSKIFQKLQNIQPSLRKPPNTPKINEEKIIEEPKRKIKL